MCDMMMAVTMRKKTEISCATAVSRPNTIVCRKTGQYEGKSHQTKGELEEGAKHYNAQAVRGPTSEYAHNLTPASPSARLEPNAPPPSQTSNLDSAPPIAAHLQNREAWLLLDSTRYVTLCTAVKAMIQPDTAANSRRHGTDSAHRRPSAFKASSIASSSPTPSYRLSSLSQRPFRQRSH